MKQHRRARTTVVNREELAKAVISRQSAGKWVKRYLERSVEGLVDRSSRLHRLTHQSPAELIGRVEAMRREGWTGCALRPPPG